MATHRAKDALAYVRNGVIWGHELEAAKAKLMENAGQWVLQTEAKQRRLVKAQALLDRLKRGEEVRHELMTCIPFARAHFGTQLEDALSGLLQQFWNVQVEIESYIDDDGNDAEFTRKHLIGIGEARAMQGEVDKIGDVIRTHGATVEEVCNPAIKLES